MYETGHEVPISGIYRVIHGEHKLPAEVMLIAGNKFPRCGKCSNAVKFELLKSSPQTGGSGVVIHEISTRDQRVA